MKTPRVALIADHPQRDLAGLVLTAMELCQKGVICYIVPLNLQEKEIWALAPDFVLLNFFRPSNESFARRLVSANIPFGLLDTEGCVWETADLSAYDELLSRDEALFKQAVSVCVWGSILEKHLVRERRLATERVVVTGCPRFDFYHPSLRSVLWHGSAIEKKEEARASILIVTQSVTVNSRFVSAEANALALEDVYGWSRERVSGFLDSEREAISATVEFVKLLARDFPRAEIVMRPHPFESPGPYEKELQGLANVSFACDGPIQPLIFGSAAVVARSSTTAIEAGMAGVPAMSPQWVPAPMLKEAAEAVSEPCGTYEELRAQLGSALGGSYRASAALGSRLDSVLRERFYLMDGRAHERVAKTIVTSLSRDRTVDEGLCKRYLFGLNVQHSVGLADLGRWTRFVFGLSPNWSFRYFRHVPFQQKRAKRFSVEEVATLAERIALAWKRSGRCSGAVSVGAALERRDYVHHLMGQSVTLTRQG